MYIQGLAVPRTRWPHENDTHHRGTQVLLLLFKVTAPSPRDGIQHDRVKHVDARIDEYLTSTATCLRILSSKVQTCTDQYSVLISTVPQVNVQYGTQDCPVRTHLEGADQRMDDVELLQEVVESRYLL